MPLVWHSVQTLDRFSLWDFEVGMPVGQTQSVRLQSGPGQTLARPVGEVLHTTGWAVGHGHLREENASMLIFLHTNLP